MQELDSMIETLLLRSNDMSLPSPSSLSVDASESVVSMALRMIARIKINR